MITDCPLITGPEMENENRIEPIAASEYSLGDQAAGDPAVLRALIVQQLASYRAAGLSHLPAGDGQFQFELTAAPGFMESDAPAAERQVTGATPRGVAGSTTSVSSEATGRSAVASREQPRNPKTAGTAAALAAPPSQRRTANVPTTAPARGASVSIDAPMPASLDLATRKSELMVLQEQVANCTLCPQLAPTRTQTVFGVGNPTARLVLVGEAPDADDDRLGEPFVGDAGQLLDKIIAACKLTRTELYILNTVKCRPPANRTPATTELDNCWGYGERQLEIIQPEFIVCLGSVAAKTVLKTSLSLGKLRRQFHNYRNSRVLVTYHPAYLLRTPSAKKHVWEDMQLLMKEMGVELTK